MERSNYNITKVKPSIKSRKNKQKDDTIISYNKNRSRANLRKKKEKDTKEEKNIIKVIINK